MKATTTTGTYRKGADISNLYKVCRVKRDGTPDLNGVSVHTSAVTPEGAEVVLKRLQGLNPKFSFVIVAPKSGL